MKESTLNSVVPAAIVRKLRLVQKRSMLVQVACALVAAAAVLLAAMGVAMLIDWLATLYDSRWRGCHKAGTRPSGDAATIIIRSCQLGTADRAGSGGFAIDPYASDDRINRR